MAVIKKGVVTTAGFELLLALAEKAGKFIMAVYERRDPPAHSVKVDSSPVTAAYLASNAVLFEILVKQ